MYPHSPLERPVADRVLSLAHVRRDDGPLFIASPMFPPDRVGGIEIVVECLANELASNGHDCVVVSPLYGDSAHVAAADRQARFPVVRTPQIPQSTFAEGPYDELQDSFRRALERAATEYGAPRIVHNHDYFLFAACRAFADRHGCPLVTTFHYCKAHELTIGCARSPTTVFRARSQKVAFQRSDVVMSVSHDLLGKLEHYYGPSPASKVTLWNPVCLSSMQRGHSLPARQARSSVIEIVVVGRLSVEKGTAQAIEMLAILRDRCRDREWDFRLRLFGSGSQAAALRELVASSGLTPFVTFEGFQPREAIIESLRSASLLVVPCRYEPFGLVCLEAMACGLPVVAAATGASTELIAHRFNGLLVETPEPAGLADAVIGLIEDDHLLESIRQRAWETAWTRHCNGDFMRLTVLHYQIALSRVQAMMTK